VIAVVTGASSGIGEAVARRLAREPDARLVLVARREDRLRALAAELGPAHSVVAADLVAEDGPRRVREHLEAEHGGHLDVLVNNAGASWRCSFADGGWDNMHKTMAINFDAVVRLTEELLPLLRASAPSSIVNVASTAGRVSRAETGAYSASKAALAAWSDTLYLEEKDNGVHVGAVLPGFIVTEGFPQRHLTRRAATRWMAGKPATGADAIADVALRRKPERYTPRIYGLVPALRHVAPGLVRRVLG
jgi:short-subunit dehydrogenase